MVSNMHTWQQVLIVQVQMNFGAALRSAFFLGAAGVLSCARNSSPLSPVVSKASAGATRCCASVACLPGTGNNPHVSFCADRNVSVAGSPMFPR